MPPLAAIYDHLHDYRAGWALLVLCFIFTVYRYNALPQKALSSKHFLHFLYGLGVALVLTYVLAAVLYLIYPNYLNPSEASVAAVSWLAIHGAPIYPDWRSGDVYGLPYGPLLFITNGATLLLVPSILGSKLAGWVAVVSALPLLYFTLRSKGTDRRVSFLLCLAAIALLSSFHEHSHAFWNRPEPFLILLTTLTLLAAQQLPTSAAAIAIGILAGLAADFKLPQGLCAMPAALAVCGSGNSWKTRCSLALLLLAGLSVIALPFLVSFRAEATIEGYISLVLTVANHGWSAGVLKDNVLFGLTLLAPIFLVRCLRGPMFLKPFESWLLVGLLVSLSMMVIISSKPGAGVHHLLPFIPISIYALSSVIEAPTARPVAGFIDRDAAALIFISLLVCYAPGEILWVRNFVNKEALQNVEYQKIRELTEFSQLYPDAEVGPSDNSHFGDTFYGPLVVFGGAPLHIDFTTWTDLAYEGVPETRIIAFLKGCKIPIWFIPMGDPFTTNNYYTNAPLVSETFRGVFFANYKLIREGMFYRVWQCREELRETSLHGRAAPTAK